MGFGHLFVDGPQDAVAAAVGRLATSRGLERVAMTPERHPRRMKEIHELQMRLYWISPRLGRWTGIFEYRFYNNETRERWGYADEHLGVALSREIGEVWRLEVLDGAGFWLYARYAEGEEAEGKAYQDTPADRTTDRSHPRYELNRIIEREGFKNVGVGYEHIPGPAVREIENVPQDARGIEGLEGFLHLAFVNPNPAAASEAPSPH